MTRNRAYFVLMGVCVTLFVLSWAVIRLYSVVAAVAISVVAMVIPPIAVFVANADDESSRRQK
jgi:NhaP-type Na+/H+ or K+/H+ antiporter